MKYSWFKALKKGLVQVVFIVASASLASLAVQLSPLNLDELTQEQVLTLVIYLVLYVARNWAKLHLSFGKYL